MLDERYRWYARLRAAGPVHWLEELGCWAVVSYDEVRRVLADPATFSSDPAQRSHPSGPVAEPVLGSIITMDPPRHDRLRRLVYRAFLPGEVRRLQDAVGEATAELFGDVLGRGEMDVVADLAFPLPASTIAHLLGVPASDRDRFFAWTEVVLETQSTGVGGRVDPEVLARRRRLREEMWAIRAAGNLASRWSWLVPPGGSFARRRQGSPAAPPVDPTLRVLQRRQEYGRPQSQGGGSLVRRIGRLPAGSLTPCRCSVRSSWPPPSSPPWWRPWRPHVPSHLATP